MEFDVSSHTYMDVKSITNINKMKIMIIIDEFLYTLLFMDMVCGSSVHNKSQGHLMRTS